MIAVFYHCWLPDEQAVEIMCDQMAALIGSGLDKNAFEIVIGHDGGEMDTQIIRSVAPKKSVIFVKPGMGEAGTIKYLKDCWLPSHSQGWEVCYHHIKGASHKGDMYQNWRRCMEREVIRNWSRCVNYLRAGYDTVGAHWYTPFDQHYWAGNFWWAKSEWLVGLPPVETNTVNGKAFGAEAWIGQSSRRPRVYDFAPHTPQKGCHP